MKQRLHLAYCRNWCRIIRELQKGPKQAKDLRKLVKSSQTLYDIIKDMRDLKIIKEPKKEDTNRDNSETFYYGGDNIDNYETDPKKLLENLKLRSSYEDPFLQHYAEIKATLTLFNPDEDLKNFTQLSNILAIEEYPKLIGKELKTVFNGILRQLEKMKREGII